MEPFLLLLSAYALGCLVAAYYLVRWRSGTDVRDTGSGNAGARNVLRTRGRVEALITMLADAAKGAVAVLFLAPFFVDAEWGAGLAFVGVILGHVWPLQLGFRGGKGAATALGGMLALSPLIVLAAAGTGLVTYAKSRNVTLSGLVGIAVCPLYYVGAGAHWSVAAGVATGCAIVLAAHHPVFARRQLVSLREVP